MTSRTTLLLLVILCGLMIVYAHEFGALMKLLLEAL
jgi:hypothetical protein